MQHSIEYSVVLPSYREAENLKNLLPKLHQAFAQLSGRYEIVVADTKDAMDDTPEVCNRYGAKHVSRGPTNCYGDAVRSGIAASSGKHIVFMDADGSHSPTFVAFLAEHRGQYDVVIASRYMQGGSTDNGFLLRMMSRILNVTYSVVLGLPCKDVSNSFRMYNGDLLRSLPLQCDNFDIVEEILVRMRLARGRLSFKEVPTHFNERECGETKRSLVRFVASYLSTMARLWLLSRKADVRPALATNKGNAIQLEKRDAA